RGASEGPAGGDRGHRRLTTRRRRGTSVRTRGGDTMLLNRVTDKLRTSVHEALTSTRGDELRPVKLLREVLGTANDLAGRPFCSQAEPDERRHEAAPTATAVKREAATGMLRYVEK